MSIKKTISSLKEHFKAYVYAQKRIIEKRSFFCAIYDNSFLTKRHAKLYGRHWKEVEKLSVQEIG